VSTSIRLDRVSVLHGSRTVLAEVSLDVAAGETLSVLGSSGSGKTTLLRAIAGFATPREGAVRIGEALASEGGRLLLPPEERNVAMVFQDLALWPHLTVHGNLAFGLDAKKVSRRERDERIAAILQRVGLSGKERRYPGELSGGERQRVAIARALVLEPRAVLLDEPLSNLDVGLRQELLALFQELLGERHATALYVTHDPREARALGDRTAVLDQGRIVHLGRLDALRGAWNSPLRKASSTRSDLELIPHAAQRWGRAAKPSRRGRDRKRRPPPQHRRPRPRRPGTRAVVPSPASPRWRSRPRG
jgi:iron(III) transport system ATP-binding protein